MIKQNNIFSARTSNPASVGGVTVTTVVYSAYYGITGIPVATQ